jgi:hypothetical protein
MYQVAEKNCSGEDDTTDNRVLILLEEREKELEIITLTRSINSKTLQQENGSFPCT